MRKKDVEKLAALPDDNGEDLAFDSTVARKCDHAECREPGTHRPVLLLVPSREYAGKPMRMPLGIVVCLNHKYPMPDPYLTQEMWLDIITGFKARGMAEPYRSGTRVDYEPHGPATHQQ